MKKPSPGKWAQGASDEQVIYAGGVRIAIVQCSRQEWRANACLIAAAPELLRALQDMLQADTAICENIGSKSDQAMQRIAALDRANAAIEFSKS